MPMKFVVFTTKNIKLMNSYDARTDFHEEELLKKKHVHHQESDVLITLLYLHLTRGILNNHLWKSLPSMH